MKLNKAIILTVLALSSVTYASDATYVFDKVEARADDGSETKLKLHIKVDDTAIPESWHWRLERDPVEKVTRNVISKHPMEFIMGHRAAIEKELKEGLDKELANTKVVVQDVKVVDMSFTQRGDQ